MQGQPGRLRQRAAGGASDVALALAAAALNFTTTLLPDPSAAYYSYQDPHVFWLLVLTVGSGLALLWRRSYPLTVFLVALGVFTLITALRWQTGALAGTMMLAGYMMGVWAPVRRGLVGIGLLWVAVLAMWLAALPYFDEPYSLSSAPIFSVPWVGGCFLRRHRREGAAHLARVIELERAQAVVAERSATDERLRIARELHDVVTHTLSVIAVQASVAQEYRDVDRAVADQALRAVASASTAALQDLRRMLGTLRSTPADGELDPYPGLEELELLVATHRVTHGPVALHIDPFLATVSPATMLTVFRIVQEALTNVAKHAPGAPAHVVIRTPDDLVEVTVEDAGSGAAVAAQGVGVSYGLAGMRERVALFGGTLEAGALPGGGFGVRATLRPEADG